MTPVLLDASCILAWLLDEPGGDAVEPALTTGFVTSVNMAECVGRIEREGDDGYSTAADLVEAGLTVVPVGWREMAPIGSLRRWEQVEGRRRLSLGDVCCIGYAMAQEMEIWTADRAWADLDLPVPVRVIR